MTKLRKGSPSRHFCQEDRIRQRRVNRENNPKQIFGFVKNRSSAKTELPTSYFLLVLQKLCKLFCLQDSDVFRKVYLHRCRTCTAQNVAAVTLSTDSCIFSEPTPQKKKPLQPGSVKKKNDVPQGWVRDRRARVRLAIWHALLLLRLRPRSGILLLLGLH